MNEFVQLSLAPLVIGTLSCVSCALLGNFLVLRRQSMVGDAISHVALPGIVAAFLVTGEIAAVPMMIGAALAAIVAVLLIEAIRIMGRVEPGAAMGVVFTAMFAAGVLLLEQSGSRNVHLDVEHALYGNLESLIWLDAESWWSVLDPRALSGLPPQLARLAMVTLATGAFVLLLWKELVVTTFDPGFADLIGIRSRTLRVRADRHGCGCGGCVVRCGRIDHCDRDVCLPARSSPADDGSSVGPDWLEHRIRGPLGDDGLLARGLWPPLARCSQ